jgi:hypothetical protein
MPRTSHIEKDNRMSTPVYGHVKQMVRRIAKQSPDDAKGIDSVYVIDQELEGWYEMGYHLLTTHYVGTTTDSMDVLYILVRE